MKPGHRKTIALLLAIAGAIAAPALFFLGDERPTSSPLGAAAGAQAFQNRMQQLDELSPHPDTSEADTSQPLADEEAPEEEAALPAEHRLEVEVILQNPELPNGCEATALTMVLHYLGYDADKVAIAYDYIPREDFTITDGQWTGGNPELVYPGDPGGAGYYCMPRVLAGAANRYLSKQAESGHVARNVTGVTEAGLKDYIAAGIPVVVWKTIDDQAPYTNIDTAWYLSDTGELYEPYNNLHVVVLTGYDEENFYISDPQALREEMPIAEFMDLFEQMGSRAIVVI